MARIQLRDTTVYLQDGLTGTGAINNDTVAATDTDVDVDALDLNGPLGSDIVPVGARFTVDSETDSPVHTVTARTPADGSATTTNIVFTPEFNAGVADDAVITFLPQRLEIKIGEGDITWSETREMLYDLDRDRLDVVRQGQDQPLSVDIAFTFEYVVSQSGKAITPVEALKNEGAADEWISSSSDACEPYAVDIYVVHDIPCGTDHDQDFLFPDFRYETLDYSIQDASISVSGQCKVTDAVSTRGADLS